MLYNAVQQVTDVMVLQAAQPVSNPYRAVLPS